MINLRLHTYSVVICVSYREHWQAAEHRQSTLAQSEAKSLNLKVIAVVPVSFAHIEAGIVPDRSLPSNTSSVRSGMFPMFWGTVPKKSLSRSQIARLCLWAIELPMRPMELGIVPVNKFSVRLSV